MTYYIDSNSWKCCAVRMLISYVYCIHIYHVHVQVDERTGLSSLCWNMAQIMDFKAAKREDNHVTLNPSSNNPRLYAKTQMLTLLKEPNLSNNPYSFENTPNIFLKRFVCACWQNIFWLPLVLLKSYKNIPSSMAYSTVQRNGSSSHLCSDCTIACVLYSPLIFGSLSD